MAIWIVLEQKNNMLTKYSRALLYALTKRVELHGQLVHAVLFSDDNGKTPEEISTLPVDTIFHVRGGCGYAARKAFATMIREHEPAMIFCSATTFTHELLDYAAADNGLVFVKDCVGIAVQNGEVVFDRPVFSGKAVAKVSCDRANSLAASFKTNAFSAEPALEPGDKGMPACHTADIAPETAGDAVRILEIIPPEIQKVGITEADIIIAGGRGLQSKEKFSILYQLAEVFRGNTAVGASRDAVNSGYATEDMQVGQTGKTITPAIYLACGISGAIQHLAGMNGSKKIIAINKDENAPIFKHADFGIVGDLFAVVPKLTKMIKERIQK
jgi:electron transfer flavoprotein alpha subunit